MALTNNQLQVVLTGIFGDGHIISPQSKNGSAAYQTNCKFEQYINFKKGLLGDLECSNGYTAKNGYSQTPIHSLRSRAHPDIEPIRISSIEENLNLVDELGVALWFYDDGSLHYKRHFYNLNTHAFSKEIQENLFIPFFNKFNIFPSIRMDKKQDGRFFYYLAVGRYEGAYEINKILRKYPVECYKYKMWNDEVFNQHDKATKEGKTKEEMKFHNRSVALKGKSGKKPKIK